jgi:hypothetical protein
METVHNVMIQNCSLQVHKIPVTGRKEYGRTSCFQGRGGWSWGREAQPLFEEGPGGGSDILAIGVNKKIRWFAPRTEVSPPPQMTLLK